MDCHCQVEFIVLPEVLWSQLSSVGLYCFRPETGERPRFRRLTSGHIHWTKIKSANSRHNKARRSTGLRKYFKMHCFVLNDRNLEIESTNWYNKKIHSKTFGVKTRVSTCYKLMQNVQSGFFLSRGSLWDSASDLHSFQEDAAALGKLRKAHGPMEVQVVSPNKRGSPIKFNKITFQLCHITKWSPMFWGELCCSLDCTVSVHTFQYMMNSI